MISENPDNAVLTAGATLPPLPGAAAAEADSGVWRGWLGFDGTCPACTKWARRAAPLLRRRRFGVAPLQTEWMRRRLGLTAGERPRAMTMFTADGRIHEGAEAMLHLARFFWWARPMRALAHVSGMRALLQRAYAWAAAHRTCTGEACAWVSGAIVHATASVSPPSNLRRLESRERDELRVHGTDLLAPLLLVATTLALRNATEPWAFMWTLAFALFFGCKWLTWCVVSRMRVRPSVIRTLAYFLAWPGMDADAFFGVHNQPKPPRSEVVAAIGKTAAGLALVFGVARIVHSEHELIGAWAGMTGLILALHFGTFHLLSIAWRSAGTNAAPIMRAPLAACSLAEFWGRRWNAAFHHLVHQLVYRPIVPRLGPKAGALAVFAVSGVVHDLVISLPAGGGYGLPTLYFLMQGAALLAQRSPAGRTLALHRGGRGRVLTLLVVALPAPFLFHETFVGEVMLPFLHVIGAL